MHEAIAVFFLLIESCIHFYKNLLRPLMNPALFSSLLQYTKDGYDMHVNILKNKKNMHCATYNNFLDDPISQQPKSPLLQAARLMPVLAIFAL